MSFFTFSVDKHVSTEPGFVEQTAASNQGGILTGRDLCCERENENGRVIDKRMEEKLMERYGLGRAQNRKGKRTHCKRMLASLDIVDDAHSDQVVPLITKPTTNSHFEKLS